MTASTRHETLIKAITDLGEAGGGKTWKIEASRQLDTIWSSAAAAIDALSADRAKRLTAAVIAVMIDRSEKQTARVLQGPPKAGSFQAEHTKPHDYEWIAMESPAYGGKKVKHNRWVYRRNRVKTWWKKRTTLIDQAKEERQRKAKIARLLKQRADLADLFKRTAAKLDRVDQELARMRVNLFSTNATLDAATVEPQPWLIAANGRVHDQAWLPVSSIEAITQILEEGGDIQWMPLTEALRDHPWAEEKTREAWAEVWRAAAARERTRIDSGLPVIRGREIDKGNGLPPKKKIRS